MVIVHLSGLCRPNNRLVHGYFLFCSAASCA
jgi:hypothetical protein